MINIFCFFACLLIFSCSNNDNTSTTVEETVHSNASDTIVTNATPFVLQGCYEMNMKMGLANLNLIVSDTFVSGKLNYHWNDNDWNEGNITGVIRNDKIHAHYTFLSEGDMKSIREVIFKIQDSVLLQGNGELTKENGKIIFINKDDLQFDTTHPFIKVNCADKESQ